MTRRIGDLKKRDHKIVSWTTEMDMRAKLQILVTKIQGTREWIKASINAKETMVVVSVFTGKTY